MYSFLGTALSVSRIFNYYYSYLPEAISLSSISIPNMTWAAYHFHSPFTLSSCILKTISKNDVLGNYLNIQEKQN